MILADFLSAFSDVCPHAFESSSSVRSTKNISQSSAWCTHHEARTFRGDTTISLFYVSFSILFLISFSSVCLASFCPRPQTATRTPLPRPPPPPKQKAASAECAREAEQVTGLKPLLGAGKRGGRGRGRGRGGRGGSGSAARGGGRTGGGRGDN